MKYILSYGGGLNSTAAFVHMMEKKIPVDLVIFANTGNEHKHTYDSVAFYKEYIESQGVEFVEVKNMLTEPVGKTLYDYCYDKKIIPFRMIRDCTAKFKVRPIRRYLRSRWGKDEGYLMYIAIDYGEAERIKDSNVQYITNSFPLVDAKIDREGCKKLLRDRKLPIPKKSGCFFCPFHNREGWMHLKKTEPALWELSISLEQNSSLFPKRTLYGDGMPLVKLTNLRGQKKVDFERNCEVSGSCFM